MSRLSPGASAEGEWTRVQRLVFPNAADRAVLPLYVLPDGDVEWTRGSLTLAAGASASTGTYFGTFASAYWLAHTPARRARLTMTVDGVAGLRLRASDADGRTRTLGEFTGTGAVSLDVGLDDASAGRVWFDAEARDGNATIRDIGWSVPGAIAHPSTATICVTTFHRETECITLLGALAADDHVLSRVDQIVVVDQGERRLRDAEGYAAVAAALGDRLRLIAQPNLGGSGGFSRGMMAAAAGESTHALLLDDDVVIEPESVLRMLDFADQTIGPRVVGAHMLSLTDRTVLHTLGERVDRARFWWAPVAPDAAPVDLARRTVHNDPALSRRIDVDFNGWWMCLIPTASIRELGASLPLFIKWDDAEFGLRAAAAGVPTVTLPGAALWHMPWTAKDDGLDWQAYYQLRNRLVAALIHSPYRRGGRVLRATLAQDVNHLLCLQYGSVAVRLLALSDVLSGPSHLLPTLENRPTAVRGLLARLGQVVVADSIPDEDSAAVSAGSSIVQASADAPVGAAASAVRLVRVIGHQLRRTPRAAVRGVPRLARSEGKWWRLGLLDAAAVASATGTGVFLMRRDRRNAVRLLRGALVLRIGLWWRWASLARAYRASAPLLTSRESWEAVFAAADGASADARIS